jgi:SAM-dependent methyltransferase
MLAGVSMPYLSGLTCINTTTSPGQPLITDPVSVLPESDPVSLAPESGPVTVLRESWDAHAKEWIDWVRAPGCQDSYWRFHRERFLPLVPDPGELTLDIGCGEGRVGRDLKERGHTVLGIDCSFTMCHASATYDESSRVIVGDAVNLPLADASADCAIAFMSLQDIDDMPSAVKEIARVLKDGQKLALAIVHPMYSGGSFTEAGKNSDNDFVIKRSYFKPELCISTDKQDNLTVTFYREHRPLEAYVQALIMAGFRIEQLHEVTDKDEGKPCHRVPMFLDILATRQPREAPEEAVHQPKSADSAIASPLRRRDRVHRKGPGNLEHRRPSRSSRERVHSTLKVPRARVMSGLPLSCSGTVLSGLILVVAIAWLAISHLRSTPGAIQPSWIDIS